MAKRMQRAVAEPQAFICYTESQLRDGSSYHSIQHVRDDTHQRNRENKLQNSESGFIAGH